MITLVADYQILHWFSFRTVVKIIIFSMCFHYAYTFVLKYIITSGDVRAPKSALEKNLVVRFLC